MTGAATNDQTVTQALEPCPLCQSSEVEFGGYGRGVYCIICKDCCIQTKFYPSRDAAAAAWNTRTAHSGEGRSNGAGEDAFDTTDIEGRLEGYTPPESEQDWDCVRAMQAIRRLRLRLAALSAPQGEVERVPADVVRLVIAAREIAFNDWDGDSEEWTVARKELDDASEAFASRVPWDDEPDAAALAQPEAGGK